MSVTDELRMVVCRKKCSILAEQLEVLIDAMLGDKPMSELTQYAHEAKRTLIDTINVAPNLH